MQFIHVSEVAAKDEFFNIENVTRDDLLAAHRIPPQLMGIVASNTGGFGADGTAAEVFAWNEIGRCNVDLHRSKSGSVTRLCASIRIRSRRRRPRCKRPGESLI